MKVAVLGASGMLGSTVVRSLADEDDVDVVAVVRHEGARDAVKSELPAVEYRYLDAERGSPGDVTAAIAGAAWVINAMGVIKHKLNERDPGDVERAVRVNALFPHLLARAAAESGARVLQIATDCVYSGGRGRYTESDEHDARDVYGKTKSVGEVRSPPMHHLRCSIIGPELASHRSLLDWFLQQPRQSKIDGFVNHRWNGVTTWHFGQICLGVMRQKLALPSIQHVVPADAVDKATLLQYFAADYGREDVAITMVEAPAAVDRTLSTIAPQTNRDLWMAAGYPEPPTIAQMVAEQAGQRAT
jgi:dTDP-4-dehydrorhamnose reductase